LLESCRRKEAVFVIDLVLFLAGVTCALFPRETKGCQIQWEFGLNSIWMYACKL